MEISVLLKMSKNDIIAYLSEKLNYEILRRALKNQFSLRDYEILLTELENYWPHDYGKGLLDQRVRKKEKVMFAMATVQKYTDDILSIGECMPSHFEAFPRKPVVLFLKRKKDALNYYHNILGITGVIWNCCKKFWGRYSILSRANLAEFHEEKVYEDQRVKEGYYWSNNNSTYHFRYCNHNRNQIEVIGSFVYDNKRTKPEDVLMPGKILKFAIDWTREIWRH